MALYSYEAFLKDGKKVIGTIDAPSQMGAKELLSKQGMYPISVTLATAQSSLSWWRRLFVRSISAKQKIVFTRQLAVLLKAGVPLLPAFELLTEQFEGSIREMVINIKDDIKQGTSLAESLKKYPKVFDTIYVQLVRAGEASGKLDSILDRLVSYLERRELIRKKIRSALQGPIMQAGIAALVVGVMVTFVVPRMASNFASQGQVLPWPTRFLMGISTFIKSYYIFVFIAIILVIMAWRSWRRSSSGRRILDRIKLKLPLIKYFTRTNAVVQFSYTLGILLESGVNLAESLDIVVKSIDNRILADTLNQARDKIIKQGRISQYLKQTDLFPPMAIYLINTGEQSGQLGSMLLTVARNYEEDLNELTDSLTAKLGPITLIGMAIVVGFIVMAMMLPMIQQMQNIGV